MNQKVAVLAVFAMFFGLLGSASAHKSEVVGNYEVEVGWETEPPIIGKENAITIMITDASTNESVEEHVESEHDDSMTESEHDDEMERGHDEASGITGLASVLEVSVTIDDEKTVLDLVEDEDMPGLYTGAYTPTKVGHPLVHVFGTINEDAIEVTFHPEAVDNTHTTPMQQQSEGVEPKNVICPEDKILLGKKSTNTAICVTQKTADLLLARDWAFHFE